jgi:hypothetical protein
VVGVVRLEVILFLFCSHLWVSLDFLNCLSSLCITSIISGKKRKGKKSKPSSCWEKAPGIAEGHPEEPQLEEAGL